MKTLRHSDEVSAFFQNCSDQCVTSLIQQRMKELIDENTSMEELVMFVILEAGDGIEQLQDQLDMPVMIDLDTPLWEVIEEHATCYELVFVLSSSGYGTLVFAPKAECAADILDLCREHAYRSPPYPPTDSSIARDTAHRGGFLLPDQTPKRSMKSVNDLVAAMVACLNDNLYELFQERAGVREYEGVQAREFAEAMALLDVIRMHPKEACDCWLS